MLRHNLTMALHMPCHAVIDLVLEQLRAALEGLGAMGQDFEYSVLLCVTVEVCRPCVAAAPT